MALNRLFFPQELLDTWIADERAELAGSELFLKSEGRRFMIAEAVHVLRDAAGGGDIGKLLGKVKTRAQLAELSAEVFEGSMVVGDDAYDVVPGFVGEPVVAHVSTPSIAPKDDDLLAQFLLKSL